MLSFTGIASYTLIHTFLHPPHPHTCTHMSIHTSTHIIHAHTHTHTHTNTHTHIQLSDASAQAVCRAREVVDDIVNNHRGMCS